MAQTLTAAPTLAARSAALNYRRNVHALASRRDPFVQSLFVPDAEFVLARDGAISVVDEDGRFHRGCSVPLLAAKAQLRAMNVTGPCGCLLDPIHAAALRVALDRLRPDQAMIAIVPNPRDAALLLHCGDFSSDIASGRCWIAFGQDWADQLRALLEQNGGLAIPTQFIRTSDADAAASDELIAISQDVFAAVSAQRKSRLDELRTKPPRRAGQLRRICIVGAQRFRLWADSAFTLAAALKDGDLAVSIFDSDDPTCATHMALALAAQDCDAIVAADLFRADAPGVIAHGVPWITWMTRPRAAPQDADCDGIIAATEAFSHIAQSKGWPAARIRVGAWPAAKLSPPPRGAVGALIADVGPLDPPAELEDLSSHRLLWEFIAEQLHRDPFAAFDRGEALLTESMRRLNVGESGLPRHRFIDGLIAPAYAVSVARILRNSGVPVTIYGRGWTHFADLAHLYGGEVTTRDRLNQIIAASSHLIHAVPSSDAHPSDFTGRPVARFTGGGARGMIEAAKSPCKPHHPSPSISADIIGQLIDL